jgi:hypothetical protein
LTEIKRQYLKAKEEVQKEQGKQRIVADLKLMNIEVLLVQHSLELNGTRYQTARA